MANYTKEKQFELIRDGVLGWENLKYIDNQYEEVCLEAVKKRGYAIEYIKKPTEEMKLEAVKQDGLAIKYIENPTEEMKLEAVKQDGDAFQFIKNPTEKVKLEAVKNYGWTIKYIENPTEEMMLEAVKSDAYAINFIKDPTEKVKLEVVKNNGWAIQYIENPTEEMMLEAVKNNGYAIQCMYEINYEICFNAILNMIECFCNIEYDYEKLKIKNINFFVTDLDLENYINDYKYECKDLYLKECDNNRNNQLLVINIDVFSKLKDYLLNYNKGNYFIFDKSIDLKTIKEVAISDNYIIYMTYNDKEYMSDILRLLSNKVANIDELLILKEVV